MKRLFYLLATIALLIWLAPFALALITAAYIYAAS